ncbi:hypothetical protein AB0O82_24520 [Kitasatospora sp. NPDC088264]|uniref:hypothetical protein n=1 Tax=Kitasatospora sp. NPDC088264 TaxID=3155296 RepID=UPI0034334C78
MEDNGELALWYTEVNELGQERRVKEWSAPGSAGCGTRATMQTDGNFVYGVGNQACWSSGTAGYTNAWLEINQSGTLSIWWTDQNLAQIGLGGLLTWIGLIPHLEWRAGTQHKISVPNCGRIKCF